MKEKGRKQTLLPHKQILLLRREGNHDYYSTLLSPWLSNQGGKSGKTTTSGSSSHSCSCWPHQALLLGCPSESSAELSALNGIFHTRVCRFLTYTEAFSSCTCAISPISGSPERATSTMRSCGWSICVMLTKLDFGRRKSACRVRLLAIRVIPWTDLNE